MIPEILEKQNFFIPNRLCTVLLLLVLWSTAVCAASESGDQVQLKKLRLERRLSSQQLQINKTPGSLPANFGLLVIPVDFLDARLPSTWNPVDQLSHRMFGAEGQTMENYFQVASDGKLALQITVAPLVNLTGARETYSDIGWHGFSRTRALATEAISTVANMGLEFRRLDMDGPDGLPGTADDDGQVDGVLILHSGAGQENDALHGLIQPLQFFIEPPVESQGVQASFYAVASLQSGLGIWAHETGHLLGMEDRYDPLLHPEAGGVDVRSLGGLGRFSLMSSGAWGTGDGNNPALPDAYTCLQLGWTSAQRFPLAGNPLCTVSPWRQDGTPPVIAWSEGLLGSEFFLMEFRDPAASYPFDAALSQSQMLVYHVDETVPEGWYKNDDSGYHLRVRLVEADNDFKLQDGEDDGRDEDTFPGPLEKTSLTPATTPGTMGYAGPSGVSLEGFSIQGSSVSFSVDDSPADYSIDLSFRVVSGTDQYLEVEVQSLGDSLSGLSCHLLVSGEGGGSFPGGSNSINFNMTESAGTWVPDETLFFIPPANPEAGAITHFNFIFSSSGLQLPAENKTWVWVSDETTFDFNNQDWVFWDQEFPNVVTNTQWYLWNQAPFLTHNGTAVLACTGENFETSANWPDVQYGRQGRAALISPPIADDILAMELVHAIEVEFLHPGQVMDGAAIFWQGPDGRLVPAIPVDGWDAVISTQSDNTLNGAEVFADSLIVLDENNYPQWRCDVLPLPTQMAGPWQLRLEFSSNYLWRFKGWFIGSITPLNFVPESAFLIKWNGSQDGSATGLYWEKPVSGTSYGNPVVEYFQPETQNFVAFSHQENQIFESGAGFQMPGSFILGQLQPLGLTRHILRIVFSGPQGEVASRSIVVYPDDGARPLGFLEQPYPNPSTGSLKFLVQVPPAETAVLNIYDLRGRLVYSKACAAGSYQNLWDGHDRQGRRLPAGNYYLKLDGSSFSSMRKVVLIR